MPFIINFKSWWRNIKASPPNLNLIFAVLLNCFDLVKTLQCSIMPFIKPPILYDRNVMAIKLISSIIECLNGSGQNRSIANVKLVAILIQGFTSLDGFLDACMERRVPVDDNLTSVQPVNRFYLFQILSPWRRNTTLYFWMRIGLQRWQSFGWWSSTT